MSYLTLVVAMVLAVVAECQGNGFRMGACPRVTVMKSVDFDKFLGDWYVIQRFNPLATCTKLIFEKSPEGVYSVNETSRPLGLPFSFQNQLLKARKIQFLRNDTNSIFRVDRNFAHMTLSTFGIVTTDYENYAVLWGCDPVLFGSVQNIDILARQPSPEAEVLQPAKDAVGEMGVDTSPMDNVMQSQCGDGGQSDAQPDDESRLTNNIVAG